MPRDLQLWPLSVSAYDPRPRAVTTRRPHTRGPASATVVLLTLLTGGCAGDQVASVMAQPGKYEFYPCPQLIEEWKRASTRERELKALMDKAGQGAGGPFVNSSPTDRTTYGAAEAAHAQSRRQPRSRSPAVAKHR